MGLLRRKPRRLKMPRHATFDPEDTASKVQLFFFWCYRFGPPITVMFNLILIFVFIVIEDNGNVYFYFAAIKVYNSQLWIRSMICLSVFFSTVSLSLLIWSFSLDNWFLLYSFNGVGRMSILSFLLIWIAWIGYFATSLTSCYYKCLHAQESVYLGELAWNAETVALNYVMTRFRTCRHPNTVRWENTIWFENMEKIGEGLEPTAAFLPVPETYFITLGFGANRSFPVFCCPGDVQYISISAAERPSLTPDDFNSESVRNCYTRKHTKPTAATTTEKPHTTTRIVSETTSDNSGAITHWADTDLFDEFKFFDDGHGLRAVYYLPPKGEKASWESANQICQVEWQKAMRANHGASLPLGINTAELEFLKNLPVMRGQMSPLAFVRKDVADRLPDISSQFISVDGKITLTNESNLEFWEAGSDVLRVSRDYSYGCMNFGQHEVTRSVCKDQKTAFICALYHESEIPQHFHQENVKIEVHDGSVFVLTVGVTENYDVARFYCRTKFLGTDIAVGFDYHELQFLKYFAVTSGHFYNGIHLGYQREPGKPLFYSNVENVPFTWTWSPFQPIIREDFKHLCLNLEWVSRSSCSTREYPYVCVHYLRTPEGGRERLQASEIIKKRSSGKGGRIHEHTHAEEEDMAPDETAELVCWKILAFFTPTASLMCAIFIVLMFSEVAATIIMKKMEKDFMVKQRTRRKPKSKTPSNT